MLLLLLFCFYCSCCCLRFVVVAAFAVVAAFVVAVSVVVAFVVVLDDAVVFGGVPAVVLAPAATGVAMRYPAGEEGLLRFPLLTTFFQSSRPSRALPGYSFLTGSAVVGRIWGHASNKNSYLKIKLGFNWKIIT